MLLNRIHNTRLLTSCSPGNPESIDASNDAEDILINKRVDLDFCSLVILHYSVDQQSLSRTLEDLLILHLEARNDIASAC